MANQPGDWSKDWSAMQQQFTSAWTDAMAQGGVQPKMPPLHAGFDMWSKLYGGAETGNDTLDRAVASSKQFVGFMQAALERAGGKAGDTSSWREALEKSFGQFSVNSNPALDAIRSSLGEGAKGWETMFAEFSKGAHPLQQQISASLDMPAFGSSRERMVQQQKLAKSFIAFNEQLNRYNALMLKASQLGMSRFESKLGEQSEPGRGVQSLRALYDLWIDAAEEGYAEVAMSDEFRNVYGELVNAQMKVRQLVQKEVEQATGQLGIPTRTEVNASHAKLADIRRRIARIEEALGLDVGAGESTAHVGDEPSEPLGPRESRTAKAKAAAPVKAKDAETAAPVSFAAQLKASRAKPAAAPRNGKSSKSKRNGDR